MEERYKLPQQGHGQNLDCSVVFVCCVVELPVTAAVIAGATAAVVSGTVVVVGASVVFINSVVVVSASAAAVVGPFVVVVVVRPTVVVASGTFVVDGSTIAVCTDVGCPVSGCVHITYIPISRVCELKRNNRQILENVAIANALQLEGRTTSRQSYWPYIYTADTLRHAAFDH